MTKKPQTYQEAHDELQKLSNQLENHEVSIDDLEGVVKRANELVKFCQEKLRSTEQLLENGGQDG